MIWKKYLHIFDKINSKGIDIKHNFKFILMDINISKIQKIKQNESEFNLSNQFDNVHLPVQHKD